MVLPSLLMVIPSKPVFSGPGESNDNIFGKYHWGSFLKCPTVMLLAGLLKLSEKSGLVVRDPKTVENSFCVRVQFKCGAWECI